MSKLSVISHFSDDVRSQEKIAKPILTIEKLVCYVTDPKIGSMFNLKVVDIKQRVTCDD